MLVEPRHDVLVVVSPLLVPSDTIESIEFGLVLFDGTAFERQVAL